MPITNVKYTEMVPTEREIAIETAFGIGDSITAGKAEQDLLTVVQAIVIHDDPTDPWYVTLSEGENTKMTLEIRCEYADRVYALDITNDTADTAAVWEDVFTEIEVKVDISKMSPLKVLNEHPDRFNETQWRTVKQLEGAFDASNGSIFNWTKRGLPVKYFGDRMFFKISDVNAFVSPSGKRAKSGWENIPV